VKKTELGGGTNLKMVSFDTGQAINLAETGQKMLALIEKDLLRINVLKEEYLRVTRPTSQEEVGLVSLSMSSFKMFLSTEQSEDHYRRSSFKVFDRDMKEIGLLEISISFIQLRRDLLEPPAEGTLEHDSFLNSKVCSCIC